MTVEILNEYKEWEAEQKISHLDTSPERFYLERAKDQALSALIRIGEIIDGVDWNDEYSDADEAHAAREIKAVLDDL